MNKRYLYRAKQIGNREWVKGFYVEKITESGGRYYIYIGIINMSGLCTTDCYYEIDPSTLCQCTGLKDKNGTLIWENDLIKQKKHLFKIKWIPGIAGFAAEPLEEGNWSPCVNTGSMETVEVIGNVFDNLELMERI